LKARAIQRSLHAAIGRKASTPGELALFREFLHAFPCVDHELPAPGNIAGYPEFRRQVRLAVALIMGPTLSSDGSNHCVSADTE
jgi:hypothetical protein